MPKKMYVGNRIVSQLDEIEQQEVEEFLQKTNPSNKNIARMLQIILKILTD